MIMLALGLGLLAAFLYTARAFSRASVSTIKSLAVWVAALGGLSLAAILMLTGRGSAAIGGLVLFGPLIWERWKQYAGQRPGLAGAGPGRGGARPRPGAMSRAEALEVLGLTDPVAEADVRDAWLRLMRVAHPDGGGSDWLASRVNQAKDVLLGK